MEVLTERLLNNYQRNFPLLPAPFEHIAQSLNTDSGTVLKRLRELQKNGAVSRVGAVFKPNTVGVSTLAAIAVPDNLLESVAPIISAFPQVNHNYEREHEYNLWFVVTARDQPALVQSLRQVEERAGYPVLSLPLVKDYHIDLGFPMQLDQQPEPVTLEETPFIPNQAITPTDPASAEDLIDAIQDGLPLVARPYREIAERLGWSEQQVIERLQQMLESGVIKRLGVVVRHHELGYRANAMVVWDVPDEFVDQLGYQLGRQDCVTLCYQRPRRLPQWPYNLFCMVHGRDRDDVLACVERMVEGLGLEQLDKSILFSGRRFKQRGARYRGTQLNG
ncbi:AsnC family transcriptional regulator [Thiogranum longum]|uniref:siroheme decarboxylase n=1 Tax=Thiogranum longum TaxID=1537524 RepID=A0A4R1HAK0_9GAMM|nr:winged helix-turn-helix transcriptional regulator [Thiogranum longum]TCK17601.1 AsnC family transcriptional regulator [Thiogranum longum]